MASIQALSNEFFDTFEIAHCLSAKVALGVRLDWRRAHDADQVWDPILTQGKSAGEQL